MAETYKYRLNIIGCGPGGSDYLTPVASTAAENAGSVFGARRLLELFPDISAETIPVTGPLEGILETIQERATAGRRVAVLVTGDPGIHSLARSVVDRVGRHNCRIIPGISSLQVAFAAVGCSWENVRVVSAHHQEPAIEPDNLSHHDRIAVLLGAGTAVEWTARAADVLRSHRCFLCEHLTLPEERVREVDGTSLRELHPAGRSVVLFVNREILT
ncbi:MAG: precorrin-6y C5,15-methyltransferase (decarboxylating) subunit CbiE [Planctomycetota bacterium]